MNLKNQSMINFIIPTYLVDKTLLKKAIKSIHDQANGCSNYIIGVIGRHINHKEMDQKCFIDAIDSPHARYCIDRGTILSSDYLIVLHEDYQFTSPWIQAIRKVDSLTDTAFKIAGISMSDYMGIPYSKFICVSTKTLKEKAFNNSIYNKAYEYKYYDMDLGFMLNSLGAPLQDSGVQVVRDPLSTTSCNEFGRTTSLELDTMVWNSLWPDYKMPQPKITSITEDILINSTASRLYHSRVRSHNIS